MGSFNLGGSERQAVQLARLLKEDGSVDVFVGAMRKEGELLAEVSAIGLGDIPEFRIGSFYGPKFVSEAMRCARFIRENGIDIIHSHDFYTNVFALAVSSVARVRMNIASKRETEGMRSPAQKFAEGVAFRRAHRIVANSGAVKRHLVANGVESRKVSVVYNGLDLERMKPRVTDRAEICGMLGLPADPETRFVTLVANLRHRVKNQFMLLRAAALLAERFGNVRFVIAGDGELRAGLENTAKGMGIAEKVHFIGRCERVPELLSVSSVGVLTSFHEGFPNAVLEYMSAGLPVVGTDVGGVAEVLEDGVNGFLVPSDDHDALADRLAVLLSDEELSENMGSAGRARVESEFSLAAQLARTLEVYGG